MNDSGTENLDALEQLSQYRRSIDNLDAALVHILAERFRCTQAVGKLKARHQFPPADPTREKHQIERLRSLAKQADLDPEFAEQFLAFIIAEVIQHHKKQAHTLQDNHNPK